MKATLDELALKITCKCQECGSIITLDMNNKFINKDIKDDNY